MKCLDMQAVMELGIHNTGTAMQKKKKQKIKSGRQTKVGALFPRFSTLHNGNVFPCGLYKIKQTVINTKEY